jgi:hypothetical protein
VRVAKSRKAKGSITTPSLGENKIFEEVKQTGKTIEEVMGIIKSKNNNDINFSKKLDIYNKIV